MFFDMIGGVLLKECMKDTKKNLTRFLLQRREWFLGFEPNPFTEAQMVMYINDGLNALKQIDAQDDEIITMYDDDGVLVFEKGN